MSGQLRRSALKQPRRASPFPVLCVAATAVLVLSAACAPGGQTEGRSSGDRDRISAAELQQVEVTNLYEAIRRLRPRWLRSRSGGGAPVVFIDNVRAGDITMLEQLYLTTVREVRFISPADATTRWGTGYPNGAIEVITRR